MTGFALDKTCKKRQVQDKEAFGIESAELFLNAYLPFMKG